MAAQFRTLTQVIEDIRFRGNFGGYEKQAHTDRLIELWNDSQQTLRELVATHKPSAYRKQTAAAALPTVPAASGETFAELPWPANAISIHSVRVRESATGDNLWRPLKEADVDALDDYQRGRRLGGYGANATLPMVYVTGEIPHGSGSDELTGTIQVAPVPQGGEYSIRYIEAWDPVTDLDAKINYVAAFHDFAVWDVVIKVTARIGKGGHTYQTAVRERESARVRIASRARRLSESMEIAPRNARLDGRRGEVWEDWE